MTNAFAPQGQPGPQGYDPNAQAGYPPLQPGYAPPAYAAQPQAYAPPTAPPQYAPMGYPMQQPQPGQFAPQGYGPQMPPAQPAVDISQYLDNGLKAQGAFWSFTGKPYGTSYTGVVQRDLTVSDIQQAEFQSQQQWNRDGSPKLRLIIPLVQPDGVEAQFDVKQGEFKTLATAINQAGVVENLSTIREIIAHIGAGDSIRVTYTHDRPNKQGQATKVKTIEFAKAGQVPVEPTAPQAHTPAAQQVLQAVAPAVQYQPHPVQAPAQYVAPQAPAQYVAPQAPMQAAPTQDPAANAAWMANISPEDQAKIALMLGQAPA